MAEIDWSKVERDYGNSTLDLDRLTRYASKAAEVLTEKGAAFDGHTDSDRASFWDEVSREGFFKTFFKDKTGLEYQHIGYWTLESTSYTFSHTDRKKTRYDGLAGNPEFSVQHKRGGSGGERWALLADGRLAWSRLRDGTFFKQRNFHSYTWHFMTEDDILLLDHRARPFDRFTNNRDGTDQSSGTSIKTSNHLLTGKKGGGCSKKLSDLLKRHGLGKDQPQRTAAPAKRGGDATPRVPQRDSQRLPIAKTYTLSQFQLQNGCTIPHTFGNGTTTQVAVRPNTNNGKVITVRTRQSGAAEAIRLVVG